MTRQRRSRPVLVPVSVPAAALVVLLAGGAMGKEPVTSASSGSAVPPAASVNAAAATTSTRSTRTAASRTTTGSRTLPPIPDDVILERDVAYLSPGRAEKLDLYMPRRREAGTRSPAVVIIHGGGWVGGDKGARREIVTGTALAQAGYVAVSVEYMKEPGKRWPTNLHDCKNAVRWLRVNAERLQVDPERIGVIGGSAGGHLALMVAYTAGIPELEPESPYPGVSSAVKACVNMYGITNLLTRQKTDKDGTPNGGVTTTSALLTVSRTENPDLWRLASPVFHVSPKCPPTMTIHGTADTTVDRDQASELDARLREHGVPHELVMIPGGKHAFPLNDKRLPEDLRPAVIRFFDRYLRE